MAWGHAGHAHDGLHLRMGDAAFGICSGHGALHGRFFFRADAACASQLLQPLRANPVMNGVRALVDDFLQQLRARVCGQLRGLAGERLHALIPVVKPQGAVARAVDV